MNTITTLDDGQDSGLVMVADLDRLLPASFAFSDDTLPVQVRIVSYQPLVVSIARRLENGMAKRSYWQCPDEFHRHVQALERLLWHLDDPAKSRWLRAHGERVSAGREFT